MGRSRRKYKKSRAKVRVGLPKKNPHVFKPAFNVPPKLRALIGEKKWDEKGTVIRNYKSLGVVSNPNLLGTSSSKGTNIGTEEAPLFIARMSYLKHHLNATQSRSRTHGEKKGQKEKTLTAGPTRKP